jgi:Fe-S oxidoreductase
MSLVNESYFSISGYIIFWVLFAIAFGFFAQRIFLLVRLILLGKKEDRFDRIIYRFTSSLGITLSQWCNLRSVNRKDWAGIGHSFMFWAFCLFLLDYLIFIGLGAGFGLSGFIVNTGFERIFSAILDIAALVIIITLIWAAVRRYILKPARLRGHKSSEAGIILLFVFSLMVLYICMEGFYLAANNVLDSFSPAGDALSNILKSSGLPPGVLLATYKGLWWLHYLMILGFLVFIPRSKHLHILASSANVVFKKLGPKGSLRLIDIQKPENLGVSKIQDFSWKQLLDGYACTVCGRCHAVCPAQLSGKTLSPRELILNMKEHLLETGPGLLKANPGTHNAETINEKVPAPSSHSDALIGGVISEEQIWACTTCRACEEVCPSCNEQMDKIIELRRHLQMVDMTETARDPLKNLRVRGHPWRGTMYARTDWMEGLDIKVISEDSNVDVLFWVGCTEALEDRSLKVAQALARLMKQAGVNFGVLGDEEMCCGDPARRLGAEHLFQMLAVNNVQIMNGYHVKKIVTACPHCFNTLRNEYPQFGGQFEVIHHTQFINDLIRDSRLRVTNKNNALVAYHDACYLGRYNDIFSPPRQILKSIPGVTLVEMEKNRQNSLCCGGGGGHMWLEEKTGQRISELRLEEAIDTKAQVVATSCPFCLQMFEDAVKAKAVDQSLQIKDIAELIVESIDSQ